MFVTTVNLVTLKARLAPLVSKVLLNKYSIIFVLVNVIVALLGFLRSFFFMKFLGFLDLGVITMLQTGAMLIGFLQFGLINGGYRLIAVQETDVVLSINNTIFSYFGVLVVLVIGCAFFLVQLDFFADPIYVFLTGFLAITMLVNNWLSNFLIASKDYIILNKANLTASVGSVIAMPLAYYYGVVGAASCIILQPFLFVCLVLFLKSGARPTQFSLKISTLRYILQYGFVPFLSGLFYLLYVQIERWSAGLYLGAEALGHAYLFFMVVVVWVLVPTSIMSLFFPRAASYFHQKHFTAMRNIIRYHFFAVFVYCTIGVTAIYFMLTPTVELIFPRHLPYVNLVIIALPGMAFRTMADPVAVFLNSIVRLRPIFYGDLLGLIVYVSAIVFFIYSHMFSLITLVWSFVIYSFVRLLYMLAVYIQIRKEYDFSEA